MTRNKKERQAEKMKNQGKDGKRALRKKKNEK